MAIESDEEKRLAERRQHERHTVEEDIFAMIGPPPSDIGQIVDISMGGFAFTYKGRKKRLKKTTDSALLFGEGHRGNHSTPFRCDVTIVSSSDSLNPVRPDLTPKKRCSMQFGELTYYQKLWLESLIQKQNHKT